MKSKMRSFVMYRHNVPTDTHDENQRNAPDEIQFEGIEFSDGTVVIRWMTAVPATSVWNSMDELLRVHGHPEYDSELVWLDKEDFLRNKITALELRNRQLIKQRDRAELKYDGACHMMENARGPDGWETFRAEDGGPGLRPVDWKARTKKALDDIAQLEFGIDCERSSTKALQWRYDELERMLRLSLEEAYGIGVDDEYAKQLTGILRARVRKGA
jgi:hypothetical protein